MEQKPKGIWFLEQIPKLRKGLVNVTQYYFTNLEQFKHHVIEMGWYINHLYCLSW